MAIKFRIHYLIESCVPQKCFGWWQFQYYFCISFAVLEDLRVHLESPEQIVEMKFLLLEQKYLELLYKGNSIEALKVSFPFNIQQFLIKRHIFYFRN